MIIGISCFPTIFVLLNTLLPSTSTNIKIGMLLETKDDTVTEAFQDALRRFNAHDSKRNKIKLIGQIEYINVSDVFHASKQACKLIENGVWTILGPNSSPISWYIDSLVAHFRIPYIAILLNEEAKITPNVTTSLTPLVSTPVSLLPSSPFSAAFARLYSTSFSHSSIGWFNEDRKYHNFTLKLIPSSKLIGRAFESMMNYHSHWKRFTIIYETNEGLIVLKNLLQINSASKAMQITVRRYQPQTNSFKKLLRDCKKHGETNFIINLDGQKILDLLNEARKAGLLTEYNNLFLFNLDISSIDLHSFEWIDTNLTALSLLDHQYIDRTGLLGTDSLITRTKLKTVSALIYDGVQLAAESMGKVLKDGSFEGPSVTCSSDKFWSHGNSLISTMKSNSFNGLTGPISFDRSGSRNSFHLNLVKLEKGKFNKIGHWNHEMDLVITEHFLHPQTNLMDKLHRKIFRVNSILSRPYLMLKRNHEKLIGNEKFEGFIVDLLDLLRKKLNFTGYTIFLGRDGSYGLAHGNGTWDDVVLNVRNQKADLVMGDITVTRSRQEKIDFTFPFINFGISLISTNPSDKVNFGLTAFLSPFSLQLWYSIGLAFIWVTVMMHLIGRLSPVEWISNEMPANKYRHIQLTNQQITIFRPKTDLYAKNHFNLSNCAWFTFCSIMQRSSNLNLRAVSTRILASSWGFFTLIIISSYTANLAAFLTSSKLEGSIESLESLLQQTRVTFGCVKGGSTYQFFKQSPDPIHQSLINVMVSSSSFTETHEEGLKRVLHGNYAFFMESTSILYYQNRYCNLTQIGTPLDDRGYGIGLPFGSPYKKLLTEAILSLRENQTISQLIHKWFHRYPQNERRKENRHHRDSDCLRKRFPEDSSQLQPGNLSGLLTMLLVGSTIACLMVSLEFVWKTREEPKNLSSEDPDECRQLLTFEHHGPSGVHLETVI